MLKNWHISPIDKTKCHNASTVSILQAYGRTPTHNNEKYAYTLCATQQQMNLTMSLLQDIPPFDG